MKRLLAILLVAVVAGGCALLPQSAKPVLMPEVKGLEQIGQMPVWCPGGSEKGRFFVMYGLLDKDGKPGYNVVYQASESEGGQYAPHERPFLIVDFDVDKDGEPFAARVYLDRNEDGVADEVMSPEVWHKKYGNNLCENANALFGK